MAKEMKKPGSPKGTPGKAAGPAKAKAPKKASTSYSPEYMSNRAQSDINDRAMKKQLSKYGMSKTEYGYKLNAGKPKRKPKAGSAVVSKAAKTGAKVAGKVAGRAKTTAREARDVVTAVGTAAKAVAGSKGKQEQYGTSAGFKGAKKRNIGSALKNVGKQIKETGKAAATGKKGTTSDKFIPMSERSKTAKYQDTVLYRSGKKRK